MNIPSEIPACRVLINVELGEIAPEECYAFAGRFRREFLNGHHDHVGCFAWTLVMRSGRQDIFRYPSWHDLDWVEKILREQLSTKPCEEF